jgi:hypothetical protein
MDISEVPQRGGGGSDGTEKKKRKGTHNTNKEI